MSAACALWIQPLRVLGTSMRCLSISSHTTSAVRLAKSTRRGPRSGPNMVSELVGIELQAGDHLAAVAAGAAEARLLRLEHDGLDAAFRQMQRRRQAAITAADDADIGHDRFRESGRGRCRRRRRRPQRRFKRKRLSHHTSRWTLASTERAARIACHSYQGMWSATLSATAQAARGVRFDGAPNAEVPPCRSNVVEPSPSSQPCWLSPRRSRQGPSPSECRPGARRLGRRLGLACRARHPGQQGLPCDGGSGARDLVCRRRGRDQAHSRPAGRSDASRRPQLRRVGRHRGRRPFEGRRTGLCRGARARCRRGRSHARQTYPERPRQDPGSHRQDAGRLHLPHALRLPDAVRARPVPPAGRVRGEFAGAGRRRGLHHAAHAPLRGGPSRAGELSPAATRSSIRSSNASTTSGPAAT